MKKKSKKHILIDTYCEGGYSYNDYKDWCEEMNVTPAEEGSDKYWEWIGNMLENDWDNLIDNIKYGKNNGKCLVTGNLGLWDGNHGIVPRIFDSLTTAIKHIAGGVDDIQAWEDNGKVTVHGMHHDGTNVFSIRPLNERRVGNREDWEIEEHDNPFWFCGRYPEYLF